MEKTEQKYLEAIVEQKLPVTIFLTCNIRLSGVIKALDENGFLVEHDGRIQFIYKHAISTISAGTALKEQFFDK